MKNRQPLLFGLLCIVAIFYAYDRMHQPLAAGILGVEEAKDGSRSMVLLSESYRIDRIFMSMQGPYSSHQAISLVASESPELIWVTGVGTEVVGRNGQKKLSEEFFCHANVSLDPAFSDPKKHNDLLKTSLDWRLFTLVPGKMRISLPEGFGIPVRSDEKLDYLSMSLNQNHESPDFQMRFKSRIEFVRDSEAKRQIKPLFMRGLYATVPLAEPGSTNAAGTAPDAICAMPGDAMIKVQGSSPGMACAPPSMTASEGGVRGKTTLHWMIPPGPSTWVTDITHQMQLNFNTTIHFATAHLHPMGESISLRDKTTGQTVVTFRSKDYSDKKGVAHMDEFSFPEGIALDRSHEYQLVTIYNNITQQMTDVMGIVYLYLHDKEFSHPASSGSRNIVTSESSDKAL